MRTISVRQPWAWLLVNGHKEVENRTWETSFRGRFLIHAGKTMTKRDYTEVVEFLADISSPVQLPAFDDLERGGVVGIADLHDCVSEYSSPYFFGPYGFLVRNARPLPYLSFKGQLGFFDVPRSALQLAVDDEREVEAAP